MRIFEECPTALLAPAQLWTHESLYDSICPISMATYKEIVDEFERAQKNFNEYSKAADDFVREVRNALIAFMGCTPKAIKMSSIGPKDEDLKPESEEERLGHLTLLNRRKNTIRFQLHLKILTSSIEESVWVQMTVSRTGNVATVTWGVDERAQVVDGDMHELCTKWTSFMLRLISARFGPPASELTV